MSVTVSEPTQAPPLLLRRAHVTETHALAALVNSAYRGESSKAGWTTEADLLGGQRTDPESLREVLGQTGIDAPVVLVSEDDAGLACCVHLEPLPGQAAYLGMLTVRPGGQARGLGRRLLAAAERWAAGHWGTREIRMTVIAQRTELIEWYERRGYRATGETRPFPYGDERFGQPRRPDLHFRVFSRRLEGLHATHEGP